MSADIPKPPAASHEPSTASPDEVVDEALAMDMATYMAEMEARTRRATAAQTAAAMLTEADATSPPDEAPAARWDYLSTDRSGPAPTVSYLVTRPDGSSCVQHMFMHPDPPRWY